METGNDRAALTTTDCVQRELDRIAVALRGAPSPERYGQLYAAQQALSWVLEPAYLAAPFDMITGTPGVTIDCSDVPHPQLS